MDDSLHPLNRSPQRNQIRVKRSNNNPGMGATTYRPANGEQGKQEQHCPSL
jgi:hypothetical protein